jgi:radical SAM protein with 4Fe4S-binding SPASM domain
MWQGIVDAAEEATRLSYSVTIYSSGHVHDFPSIAARLREAGVKRFVFSLFGDTALCHERVTRIRGSFQKTIAGVTTCAKMGIETEIHFVPLASNCRSLCGIAVLARKAGAARISVLRFVPQGRGALLRSEALTRAQNLELKRTIEQLRSEGHAVRTGSPFNFLMVNDSPKCCSGIDRLIVTPDSRICPCDAFKQIHAEDLVGTADGSVLNGVSLGECWEKSPYLLAVRKYLTTPFAPDCQPCRLLEDCLSGCLAQKVLAYGGLDKRPDPDCIKN